MSYWRKNAGLLIEAQQLLFPGMKVGPGEAPRKMRPAVTPPKPKPSTRPKRTRRPKVNEPPPGGWRPEDAVQRTPKKKRDKPRKGDVLLNIVGNSINVYEALGGGRVSPQVAKSSTMMRKRSLTLYGKAGLATKTVPAPDFTPRQVEKHPRKIVRKYLSSLLQVNPNARIFIKPSGAPHYRLVTEPKPSKGKGPNQVTVRRYNAKTGTEYDVTFRVGDAVWRYIGGGVGYAEEKIYAISTTKLRDRSQGIAYAEGPRFKTGTPPHKGTWHVHNHFRDPDDKTRIKEVPKTKPRPRVIGGLTRAEFRKHMLDWTSSLEELTHILRDRVVDNTTKASINQRISVLNKRSAHDVETPEQAQQFAKDVEALKAELEALPSASKAVAPKPKRAPRGRTGRKEGDLYPRDVMLAIGDVGEWYKGQGYGDVRTFGVEGYSSPAEKEAFKGAFEEWLFNVGWEAGQAGHKVPTIDTRFVKLARKLGMQRKQRNIIRAGWEEGKGVS